MELVTVKSNYFPRNAVNNENLTLRVSLTQAQALSSNISKPFPSPSA